MFPSNGLVSILKKRACVKGTESLDPQKTSKRKVRFIEPDDAFDQGMTFVNRLLLKSIKYSALCLH